MIFGIGTDLLDIRRIQGAVDRFGRVFAQRILSPGDWETVPSFSSSCVSSPTPSPCVTPPPFVGVLAKRFAAKEACAKALGCGIGRHLGWHDMTVRHQLAGRPHLVLSPSATAYLRAQVGGQRDFKLDLSLSDEYPYIQAFVVISHLTRGSYG